MPELALSRVKSRVSKGGHDVPAEDVVRRYFRSKQNLPRAVALVDSYTIVDNSDRQYIDATLEDVLKT